MNSQCLGLRSAITPQLGLESWGGIPALHPGEEFPPLPHILERNCCPCPSSIQGEMVKHPSAGPGLFPSLCTEHSTLAVFGNSAFPEASASAPCLSCSAH